jgi:long-chain acyl-CoA synthetase
MRTFTDLCSTLHAHATKDPQKTALICGDATMSYLGLDESSTRLAHWFLDQGLQPGDRVALHWSNSIEVVQLFFSLFKAGLVPVAVNVRLKPLEIRYVLDHSQARICFSEPALAPLAEQSGTTCTILTELPAIEAAKAADRELPPLDPDQPAVLLYTSGTTARPKGVIHTNRSLLHTAAIVAREVMESDDVAMAITQLMHASGFFLVLLPAIYLGSSVVLVPAFSPAAVLDGIQQFHCTYVFSLPALLHSVIEEQARAPRNISSLRSAFAGGDKVPVALQQKFQELFGFSLREGYGMTETLPVTLNPKAAIRPGSIGERVKDFQVRIVDPSGRGVAMGETGEIVVRSPANCVGYWNDPEATTLLFRDEWLHTGDLASRDAEGYFWFKGRQKQIIIRGGSNISPQEVEEALYQHPAVLEAGVIGEPDPVLGEKVVAFVVLREGREAAPDELCQFARQRLADYKVPERILYLDELPKSPTGKIQRSALKETLLAPVASGQSVVEP